MKVDVRQVRKIVLRLLDHIIERHEVVEVDLNKDFFWVVPPDSVYEVEHQPSQLDVGSLEDEWQFVSSLLNPDARPTAYQLTQIAPILAAMGVSLGQELAGKGG